MEAQLTRIPPLTALAAALALSACQAAGPSAGATGSGLSPARSQALAVAESLRGAEGISEVSVEGTTVAATLDAPIPGASLDAAAQARIADAMRATFVATTCQKAQLDAFFAAGGALTLTARGSDGARIAQVPVTSCV